MLYEVSGRPRRIHSMDFDSEPHFSASPNEKIPGRQSRRRKAPAGVRTESIPKFLHQVVDTPRCPTCTKRSRNRKLQADISKFVQAIEGGEHATRTSWQNVNLEFVRELRCVQSRKGLLHSASLRRSTELTVYVILYFFVSRILFGWHLCRRSTVCCSTWAAYGFTTLFHCRKTLHDSLSDSFKSIFIPLHFIPFAGHGGQIGVRDSWRSLRAPLSRPRLTADKFAMTIHQMYFEPTFSFY